MSGKTLIAKIMSPLGDGVLRGGQKSRFALNQTLCQDATGTMAFLELEAMGVDRVRPSCRSRR